MIIVGKLQYESQGSGKAVILVYSICPRLPLLTEVLSGLQGYRYDLAHPALESTATARPMLNGQLLAL